MCGMCLVIGVVAVVGGIIAFVSGKVSGKTKSEE